MNNQAPQNSGFRKTVVFQAILLGTFTLLATALLSISDIGTRDTIKLRVEEDLKASIAQVIPNDLHDNDLLKSTVLFKGPDGEPLTVYKATKDGAISALAYIVNGFGYAGKITAIMAVNPKGEILGVRILSHAETPGLGDKIEVKKDDWILGFDGLSLDLLPEREWGVKKDGGHFDQFTGATITPKAVVKSVKEGLLLFADQKKGLLAPTAKRDSKLPTISRDDVAANSETKEVL